MKIFVFVFVFLFFILIALPLAAAEKTEQAAPPPQKQTATPKKIIKNPQPPVKIQNFQPTERIKADTVVAFPADI